MSDKYLDVEYAVTTVAGTASINTLATLIGMVNTVEVVAPSSTTIQTLTVTDKKGVAVWSGTFRGSMAYQTRFPIRGIATLSLSGASSSGANTIRILAGFE